MLMRQYLYRTITNKYMTKYVVWNVLFRIDTEKLIDEKGQIEISDLTVQAVLKSATYVCKSDNDDQVIEEFDSGAYKKQRV